MNKTFRKTALLAGAFSLLGLCYSPKAYAADAPQEVQQAKKITGTVVDAMGLAKVAIQIGREILELALVGTNEDIAVLKAVLLSLGIELHTVGHILHGDISIAPMEKDHRVDKQGEQEIDEHTANHD